MLPKQHGTQTPSKLLNEALPLSGRFSEGGLDAFCTSGVDGGISPPAPLVNSKPFNSRAIILSPSTTQSSTTSEILSIKRKSFGVGHLLVIRCIFREKMHYDGGSATLAS